MRTATADLSDTRRMAATVLFPREPLTRRQRLALDLSPDRLGGLFLVAGAFSLVVGVVLLAAGLIGADPGQWQTGAVMLAAAAGWGTGLAVGADAERRLTVEVSTAEGIAIHLRNGVDAWQALPPLLRAETSPLLSGLYDAAVVASREPREAALRKRVVDRVLLLQRIGQVDAQTAEVARRQAAAQARGALDDTDLDVGAYTLTVLQEGLAALGADDALLDQISAPHVDAAAAAQADAIKRLDKQRAGYDRHVRYHRDRQPSCHHCDAAGFRDPRFADRQLRR